MIQHDALPPLPDPPSDATHQPVHVARAPFVPPAVTDLGGLADLTLFEGSL
jgi:hypothetical protein